MWFVFALLSAVFYALLYVFARMSRGIPASVSTAVQHLLGPILLIYSCWTLDYPWGELWWWGYFLLMFLVVPVAMWASTYVVQRSQVTLVKPILGLSSISALLFAVTFFEEEITSVGVCGIVVMTFGLLFLYHGRWSEWKQYGPWIMLGVALFFGVYASIAREVLQRFPHIIAIAGMHFTANLIGNGFFSLRGLKHIQWSWYTLGILTCLFLANIGQDFMTLIAFTLGPSSYVIAIKRTSILITAIIGYVFLKERDQSLIRLLAASGLVVIGVALLTMF